MKNLMTVLKEMRRIRHIHIQLTIFLGEHTELFALLEQPAPRVESMQLFMTDISRRLSFPFPIISPGVLRSVELSYMNISSNLFRLSQLTELSLKYCKKLSLMDLFGVLQRSPELQTLSVVYCEVTPSSISNTAPLPRLLDLHLETAYFKDCYDFIANIETPNVLRWTVNCEEMVALDDLPKLDVFSKLLQVEYEVDRVQISTAVTYYRPYDPPWIHVKVIDDSEESETDAAKANLGLLFHQTNFNAVILRLLEIFKWHVGEAYVIDIDNPDDSVSVETWRSVFCASVSAWVVQVLVVDKSDNETNCVKALCPHPTGDAEEKVPCPKAKHIELRWLSKNSDVDQLLLALEEVVTTRAEHQPVQKLSVFLRFDVQEDDERLASLSQKVQKFEWTNKP